MDRCPPELHSYICQLTYVDGDGRTTRSLNKVSRYFHDISNPYLYQTLCISGPKQIRAISALLETKPKSYLRYIRHLYISDTADCVEKCVTESAIQSTQILFRMISLAASTLESLAFIANSPQTSTSLIARLFRTSFPRLLDLSICGFYPFPTTRGKFPRLERLHLNGNRNPHGLLQMSILENTFPSLKSLKVSGLGFATSFVKEVKEAMENSESGGEELFPAKFPARVRRITLQAGLPPEAVKGGKYGSVQLKDDLMMKNLDDLISLETTGVQVIVLDRQHQPDIKEEWLESLESITTFL